MNNEHKKAAQKHQSKKKFRLFTVLPSPNMISPQNYATIPYRRKKFPTQITPPAKATEYARTDSGIGGVFFTVGQDAFKRALINNHDFSYEGGRKEMVIAQAHHYNTIFNETRSEIHHALEAYLIEHNGVVDGWPDPEPGWGFTVNAARDSDINQIDESESYIFHFFGGQFEGTEFGYLLSHKPEYSTLHVSWSDYEPIIAANVDKDILLSQCRDFPLLDLSVELFKLWLRCIVPIICICSVVFSLGMGLFGWTTDTFIPLVNLLSPLKEFTQLPVPLMLLCGFLLLLLLGVPIVAIYLCTLSGFVFSLFTSVVGNQIIAALLTSVILVIGCLIGENYVLKVIPTPELFDPRVTYRARRTIHEIEQRMQSPAFQKIVAENDEDRNEKQHLIDSFYSQWFSFYEKVKGLK